VNARPCFRHAGKTASVVCARCDRPICTDCMIQAPVGWQCPDCVHSGAKQTRVIRPFANPGRTGVVGSTNPTPMVIGLIAVNVLVFVASGFGKSSVLDRFGEWPYAIHAAHQYYRVFDAMFLHFNFEHILFNMVTLAIVGPAVEVLLGRSRFVILYLIGGLGGGVLSYLLGPSNTLGAGASGAIFGVMGAYVVVAQRRGIPQGPVPALIVINLVLDFTGLLGSVDWLAHIGGLLVGGALALVFDLSCNMRQISQQVALVAATSAATLAVLTLLLVSIAPGHVNIG
jgi:membrane associated rhomboid family serine protease